MASENSLAQLYDDYMDGIQVIEIDGVKESFDDYQKRMGGIDYESKAHGGSVGIEILFGPKRDNFRYGGDTMGGKNDKSKSSPGPDRSRVSAQQQSNHDRAMAAAQGSGGGISNLTNNINKTNFLDKVKNTANKVVDSPLTKFLDPRSKIALAMGGYKLLRDGIPKLEDFENEAINQELKNIQTKGGISPYADGGRVGFFMGGPALEGEALSIYNSMSAYGNTDQQIADKLQSLGMYTPGGSTPDTPDTPDTTPGQTYGLQSGNDNFSPYNPDPNRIQSFKTDSRIAAANEADIRNKQLTSMGIEDPFADEISLSGAYYGDMPTDTSNQIGKQSMFAKAKQGLTGLMDNPLVNLISSSTPFGMAKNFFKGIGSKMPVNQRAIQENIMGNMGFAVNDIGQIVSTGDYNDPENVMAGYNLYRMTPETFMKRIASIKNRKAAQTDASRRRIAAIEEAQRKFEAAEKLKRLAVEEAKLKKGKAPSGGTWQGGGGPAYTGPGGVGGGEFKDSMGNTDYQDAYDPGGGEKDGGIIGYRNGGLATMFTRRR